MIFVCNAVSHVFHVCRGEAPGLHESLDAAPLPDDLHDPAHSGGVGVPSPGARPGAVRIPGPPLLLVSISLTRCSTWRCADPRSSTPTGEYLPHPVLDLALCGSLVLHSYWYVLSPASGPAVVWTTFSKVEFDVFFTVRNVAAEK